MYRGASAAEAATGVASARRSPAWTAIGREWYAALGARRIHEAAPEGEYERLAERSLSLRTHELGIMQKDIGRTFPDHAEFQTPAARTALRRVLGAYAVRHTYCQGLSYVAALLLRHLPLLLLLQ